MRECAASCPDAWYLNAVQPQLRASGSVSSPLSELRARDCDLLRRGRAKSNADARSCSGSFMLSRYFCRWLLMW